MIRLFDLTDTDFSSNGDIVLNPLKAILHKEDNGEYYVNITVGYEYMDYFTEGRILAIDTPQGVQPFRVGSLTKHRNKVESKCYHLFYDTQNYLIADSYVVDKNCADALNHLNTATKPQSPFICDSNVSTIKSFRCVRKSLYEAIQTVLERWGGHLVRDGRNISIMTSVGQDNGIVVEYGKNLKDITVNENWNGVVTEILPVGRDGILLNALDSSASIYVQSSVQYDIPYTRAVSFTQEINSEDYADETAYKQALVDDLRAQATAYVNTYCYPQINYTLKANVEKLTDVGDVIRVLDKRLNLDILTNVISFEYDCILGRFTQVEFGNFKQTISGLVSNINSSTTRIVNDEVDAAVSDVRIALNNKVDKETGKGLSTNDYTTAEKTKLAGIQAGAEVNVQSDWNVTNTGSDAYIKNKPDLSLKIDTSEKGSANGVAELDANGKVPSGQLPSYVDDVLEYASKASFPATGETGKIYVDTSTNVTWRWGGSTYVEISPSLALGETSTTAYRGDRGKTAYTHATDSARLTTATASGLYKVASTAQGHIASLTAVTKADITGLGIPAQDTTYSEATSSTYGLVKIGYSESGKNYAVKLSSGKMYVNVPWENTTYTPASAAPKNIGTAAVGTSAKYAREDHVHAISLATGDANGQVKIAGTNVSVKGLAALAYKASLSASDVGALPSTTKYAGSDTVGGTANSAYALTHKTLTSTTLDSTSGTFAFSGSGDPWSGTDWVGIQIGDSVDKFQLTVNGGNLLVRQNDSGGTNSANWTDWKTLTPVRVKGNAETSYRTGDVNLTPANIGALALSGGTMTGDITLNSAGVNIIQKLNDTSNYGVAIGWNNATAYTNSYFPQIGFHNTGETIMLIPYAQDDAPWNYKVGLAIRKSTLLYNNKYVGNFTTTPTTGQVVVTDGTTGGIKSSGYTIAKSVPSDAKFTDTNTTYSAGSNITLTGTVFSLTKANVTGALGYTPPTTNTTYSDMTGATASAAGTHGLVPAPAKGKQTSFLRGDGTWVVPTNTTYSAGDNVTLTGTVFSLTKANVTGALGYTPTTGSIVSSTVTPVLAYYSAAQTVHPYLRVRTIGSARYPLDITLHNDAGTKVGEMWYDQGTTTNVTTGGWCFRAWSPKSTADTGVTSYYETCRLPAVNVGRTANAVYDILTSKSAVTIAQGGTGATTAADARTNLGVKATQTAVTDPTASGTSATFIATITQNAQGVITPTKKTVRSATASQSGLMSAADKKALDTLKASGIYNSGYVYVNADGDEILSSVLHKLSLLVMRTYGGGFDGAWIYDSEYHLLYMLGGLSGASGTVYVSGNKLYAKAPTGKTGNLYIYTLIGAGL